MSTLSARLPRFRPLAPWANRILRIDLDNMTIHAQEAEPYIPDYLGGRGFAARLAWDEYPRPVPPFDPANPLMVFAGALTGSRAPYSGRANVCAFSPQAWPHPWFTRSSIGKHIGGELKRAGYDGLVVTGAAEEPVQIVIRDDEVSILPAAELWGLDALDTLEALGAGEHGHVRALAIGPAGEHLSHIATIQTASSSAAGQGGFGGVMGSKKLKALSVVGTGHVPLAHPERVTALARALARELPQGPAFFGRDLAQLNAQLAAEGNGQARVIACTEGCVTPCQAYLEDVPGVVHLRRWSGAWFCVATLWGGGVLGLDWKLDRRAAFEANVLCNRYGLNQFEMGAMILWLLRCQRAGLLTELNGQPIDWNSPFFWSHFMHAMAFREGLGEILGKGGWAAARELGLGEELARAVYACWGQSTHWDGHFDSSLVYPYWLVSALQWMSDTRDPYDSGHNYVNVATSARERLAQEETPTGRDAAISMWRALGNRAYGDADALDPLSGYRGKARPAFFQTLRAVIKDCVPVDDLVFPLVYDRKAPDGFRVLHDVDGLGDVDGPAVEHLLFAAGTGLDWSSGELDRAARRVHALERALQVCHWGRDRQTDELALPYFERPEAGMNPLLGERYGLDRAQFAPVVDEFYALHGWDQRGWPTREHLEGLGLRDVYEPMVRGANESART